MADPTPLSGLAKLAADTRGLKRRSETLEAPTGTQYGRATQTAQTAEGKADGAQLSADYAQETADEAADRAEEIAQLTAEANERAEDALAGLIEAKRLIGETEVELDEKIGQLNVQLGNTASGLLEAQGRIDDTFTEIDGVRQIASGASTTATAAQAAAAEASAQAIANALSAFVTGRTWIQDTEPPLGAITRWTGTANSSTSERVIDGKVVATNRALGGRGVLGTSIFANNRALHTITPNVTVPPTPNGVTTAAMTQIATGTTPGQLLSVYNVDGMGAAPVARVTGVYIMTPNDGYRARMGSGEWVILTPNVWAWAVGATTAGRNDIAVVEKIDSSVPAATDRAYITSVFTSYTFTPAPKPTDFFDGASLNDRALDLWIDTKNGANTPKRINGTVWTAITDKAALDATQAAVAAGNAAAAAKLAADSKSKVWPTAPTPPTSGMAVDDLFVRSTDGALLRYAGVPLGWAVLPLATQGYVQSRGFSLVTNGSGFLGDNTNFRGFEFDTSDHPTGAAGMFTTPKTVNISDELIPVDPSKIYELSFAAKQLVSGGTPRFYSLVAPYDVDGLPIQTQYTGVRGGTLTTLAQPLKKGDTTVTLTSGSGWGTTDAASRYLAVYGYVDGRGYTWPDGVYTRTMQAYGAISGNVVTLNSPWVFADVPAGRAVGNSFASGTYIYPHSNVLIPSDAWGQFSGRVSGIHTQANQSWDTRLPVPTAFVKVGFLPNRGTPPTNSKQGFANINFTEVTVAANAQVAAQAADDKAVAARGVADKAVADAATAAGAAATAKTAAEAADKKALDAAGLAEKKGEVIYQLSAPTGTRANAANLWIRTTDNRPATYNGTTWVPITDKVATDAAAAASSAASAASGAQSTADKAAAAAKAAQDTATAAGNAALIAQQTADGKPTLRYGTAGPSGAQPFGSWYFQLNASGEILNQYQQTASGNGSTWSIRPITNEAIANLDVGKLRVISANIADAVVQKIVAQTANIQTVNASNIFVSGTASLSTALIEKLFVEVVKARTVTATEGFIGSSALIDGAITARTIAADAFTGKTFSGVTFTGVRMTGATLTTADSGQRVELTRTSIQFYSEDSNLSGNIFARPMQIRIGTDRGAYINIGDTDRFGVASDLYAYRVSFDSVRVNSGSSVEDAILKMGVAAAGTKGNFYSDDVVQLRTRAASIKRLYAEEIWDTESEDGYNLLATIPKIDLTYNETAVPQNGVATNNPDIYTKLNGARSSRMRRKIRFVRTTLDFQGAATKVLFAQPFPLACLHVSIMTTSGTGITPVINSGVIDRFGFQPIWVGAGARDVTFTYEAIGA